MSHGEHSSAEQENPVTDGNEGEGASPEAPEFASDISNKTRAVCLAVLLVLAAGFHQAFQAYQPHGQTPAASTDAAPKP